ncbi:Disease resistance protein [Corchorus capsularis]|uniref:Disease resistance protein n=1 Tax=Corchorus capsularis TaxID=210143 RepID=A0A1R3GHB6_COCAP|nr:Disease resistance protein [Corchorus capsularis]
MEAVAAVGEAFFTTMLEGLLDKFAATSDLINFAKNNKLHLELKKWHQILQSINAVLSDAEEKQVTNKTVRIWLTELRDLAYEVEDVLDNLAYEAWKRKSKAQQPRTKFEKLIIFPYGLKSAVMFGVEMEPKLKKITRRLQEIAKQKNELQLKEGEISMAYYKDQRLPTTSLVNQVNVFIGREKDKEAILKLLLVDQKSSTENEVPLALIPITGMGGIGKTTLAQLVYNDDRVDNFFDLKAWIYVSQDFDVIKVTKAILQAINITPVTTCECDHINDLDLLHLKLKEKISGKKLLIVLDDVWHENCDGWELLLRPFEVGNSSVCKIIVTTRNQNVSQITANLLPAAYPLKELADDDCLSILACHVNVFGSKNFDAQPHLKEFGREIVRKCKGLPLAVKASAGLLRAKLLDKEWEALGRSKIWDLSEIMQRGVFPALRLSYHHLPCHLKPCFAYCSLLPKGYQFDREELVLLWMAEGFLQLKGNIMQPQELGRHYFSDLLSRSFFRQSNKNKSLFVMHDLLIDLAQSVAGDLCLNMEHELQIDEHNLENARHVSFIRRQYDVSQRFQVFNKMKNVRSLIALPMSYQENHCYLSCKVLDQLLPKLKRLRVLSLSGYFFEDLPDTVGDLNHLRYLNLSKTGIRLLPKSIGKLHHLQILILAHCRNLIEMPVEICRLIQLQHLDIRDTPKLQEMPPGLGKLTSLRVLPKYVIGKAGGLTLRDLKDLPLLQGQLCICISRLHNVVDVRDARDANLKQKSNLRELALEWSSNQKLTSNSCSDLEVLESLRPSKDLQRLSISCYGATMFPSWVRNPYLAKIVQIDLFDCINCASLPSLGQLPLLRILNVKGMNAFTSLGPEFYGDGSPFLKKAFPSLELLRFEKMKKWEEWNSCVGNVQVFPLLRELVLQDCQILAAKLPGILPSLVKLDVKRCPQLIHSPLSFPCLGELNVEDNSDLILTSMVEQSSIITKLIMKGISGLTCLTEKLTKALAKLEVLEIGGCKELTCLWPKRSELENMPCLKNLVIKSCPKLVSLVGEKEGLSCLSALIKLKCLTIHNCMAMESLPDTFEIMNDLKELEIFGCPSLLFFPEGKLPFTLKRLSIRNCRNIQCLLDGNKSHLEYLCIDDRLALESFSESGFQIPNLQIFHIFNINSLPNQMRKLTSLGELSLSNCEALESIPSSGLPPNITSLKFCNCKNLKQPMLEWGLSKLNCLKELKITGACPAADMVSFPDDEGEMLPSTLTTLFMENMKNLESLSRGLGNLGDLEQLCMKDCPKLRTLPRTAMPVSLGRMYIFGCPVLQERCNKNRGQYWPIISHIPCLEID